MDEQVEQMINQLQEMFPNIDKELIEQLFIENSKLHLIKKNNPSKTTSLILPQKNYLSLTNLLNLNLLQKPKTRELVTHLTIQRSRGVF